MKTLLRLCMVSLLVPLLACMTQAQKLEWVMTYGTAGNEKAEAVTVDGSGNVIFVGSFSGTIDFDPGTGTQDITANSTDFYIQKVDSDGALIWAYGIGGSSGDFAYDVAVDASDNIYVAGAYRNTVDFDPSAVITEVTSGTTNASLFVLKLTSGGGFEWVYALPGSGEAIALETDASGNVYVTGYNLAAEDFDNTSGTALLGGNGLSDIFLIKLNSSGVYQSGVSFGGTGNDIGESLVVDDLGNIYLGGTFSATVDFDPGTGTEELISEGGTDAFVLRLTSSMEYSLVYSLGGTSEDHLNSLAIASDYSIVAVGDFLGTVDLNPFEGVSESTASNRDAFVLKVSELGVFEWVGVINFGSAIEGFTVAVDDNDYVYAGGAIGPLYIYDAAGTSLFNGFNTGVTLNDIAVDGANLIVAASHNSGNNIVDFEPCGTGTNPGWAGGTDMAHVKYAIDRLADEPTIFANSSGFCGDQGSATLMVTAGALNDAADWYWYSGSCGGTLLGTGTSIVVSLSETTSYYVRGGGNSCVTGTAPCASTTITKFDPPTDILLSNLTVSENLDAGAVIGDLSAVDATPDDTHTFAMNFESNGNNYDNANFNVVNQQLVSTIVFDYEIKSTYSVRLRVEDAAGCIASKFFTITIIDDQTEPVTWNGSAWTNGTGPTSAVNAIISGNYDFGTDGTFSAKDLTINSGKTLTVEDGNSLTVNGDLVNNGTMYVESGASLITFGTNSILGNSITIKRNTRYADGKYSFVGSPVIEDISITGSNLGTNVYKYDETVAYGTSEGLLRWKNASSEVLTPGKGYTQAFQQEITFVGVPNAGTITYTGTYSEDVDNAFEGWNLVANPYPAAINVADFLVENDNIAGAVYIWDDNGSNTGRGSNSDYIVANGTVATNTTPAGGQSRYNQALGSSQGFFVKLNSSLNTDIVFNEGMRETAQNSDDNFFRNEAKNLSYLRINLTNQEGLFKQAIVGWLAEISNDEVDRRFDAAIFNSKSDYSIFTVKANIPLAIQGITSLKKEIPLGFNVAESGNYSIEFDLENYLGQTVLLKDNLTGEIVDLSLGAYGFSSRAGQITERFVLLVASAVLASEDQNPNIYVFGKVLHIETTGFQPAQFQIYNLSGAHLMTVFTNGKTDVDLNHLTSGLYFVSDGVEAQKIILK